MGSCHRVTKLPRAFILRDLLTLNSILSLLSWLEDWVSS